jgi:hypothetical protein
VSTMMSITQARLTYLSGLVFISHPTYSPVGVTEGRGKFT